MIIKRKRTLFVNLLRILPNFSSQPIRFKVKKKKSTFHKFLPILLLVTKDRIPIFGNYFQDPSGYRITRRKWRLLLQIIFSLYRTAVLILRDNRDNHYRKNYARVFLSRLSSLSPPLSRVCLSSGDRPR